MALEKAVKFIKDSMGSSDIKEKLKGIDVSDKNKALQTITKIGEELGYEFNADEYEQAAKEMYLLYDVEHKGIEEIYANESESNCTCSGCAACAACTACLACISCAFCIAIPIAGEAVIAADAAGVVSAAASLSTGVSTGVAVAAQGG